MIDSLYRISIYCGCRSSIYRIILWLALYRIDTYCSMLPPDVASVYIIIWLTLYIELTLIVARCHQMALVCASSGYVSWGYSCDWLSVNSRGTCRVSRPYESWHDVAYLPSWWTFSYRTNTCILSRFPSDIAAHLAGPVLPHQAPASLASRLSSLSGPYVSILEKSNALKWSKNKNSEIIY